MKAALEERARAARAARTHLGRAARLYFAGYATDHKKIGKRYLVTAFVFSRPAGWRRC